MEVKVNCEHMEQGLELKQQLDDLGVTQADFSKFTKIPTSTLARVFGGAQCRASTVSRVRRGLERFKEHQTRTEKKLAAVS